MPTDSLLSKYHAALAEIDRLRSENAMLKQKLGIAEEITSVSIDTSESKSNENEGTAAVRKYSSPEAKIALFRSLFAGREDVYARRWESVTTGKSGYQPVCGNEWQPGLCDKHSFKCSVCPNRKLLPLDDAAVYAHLAGKDEHCRDVIGIYPMLADETCFFLAADFDDEHFMTDVSAYREVCAEWDIPVYVERSRSGNGAHAWIFFSEPVISATARKLGSLILTAAMERNPDLSFKSYDRLFPNQDTMPSGGFGNLIALPLQGKARKSGNSVFVDENFMPYPDQWAYLSCTQKLSSTQVDSIIVLNTKTDILGDLAGSDYEKPWEKKKRQSLVKTDFPEKVQVIRANMLYISRSGLSAHAVNAVKRLAAFKNPDFYKAQAMRMPTYNKPRIICCASIDEKYAAIPRGCEDALKVLLTNANAPYEITDKTNPGTDIAIKFNGSLRYEQQLAAKSLLQYDIGVLSATTAFGKTVIASYIIGQRKINTLILVHTQALLMQWKKALEQFLLINTKIEQPDKRGRRKDSSPVGLLGVGKNTLHGIVDVAIIQSVVDGGDVKDFVKDYGMVIVDECHHVSAFSFEKVLREANAKYVYGLTATPTRQDGHHPIVFMQCGAVRYRVDAKGQAEKRPFEHILIPRFTTYRTSADKTITQLYKALSGNEQRNRLIADDVLLSLRQGRTPIILTERREHITALETLLSPRCKNIITLTGTASQKERREMMERLESIPDSAPMIVIATGKYIGEGFDYPRLDTLFLALPIAWKGKLAQYAGRLHRNYTGKSEVQVYDYIDFHVPMLERMYQKRVSGYSSIGYKTKASVEKPLSPDVIYDGKTFYPIFTADIENAASEILIVSPFMRKSRISQMIKLLAPKLVNGVAITIITRPADDFKETEQETVMKCAELLTSCGISVRYKCGFHQKFAVIDNRIAWYGSVNFLSFGRNEESIMRLENEDVAGTLVETVT